MISIGHFLLTSLLTPLLLKAAETTEPGATRVVNTTSAGYVLSPIRFQDFNFEGKAVPPEEQPPAFVADRLRPTPEKPYHGFCAYGQSKTANILHALRINQKFGSQGLRALAVHPGSIWTDLSRNLNDEDAKFIETTNTFWKSTDQGTAPILAAAFDPDLAPRGLNVYVADCKIEEVQTHAKDGAAAERLWQLSEELTNLHNKL